MSQLRRLKNCTLEIVKKEKQSNGITIDIFTEVKPYKITIQELTDEVSASIYGAKINSTYRINSPRNTLESYLSTKSNDKDDNISKYLIFMENKRYKIVSVKSKWIDIELV